MNLRITCVILGSFVIAFSILYFIVSWYESKYDESYKWAELLKQSSDNHKKIFLLGSSHVAALNTTYINEYISENNKEYKVYNLATPSDYPSRRLETLGSLISLKPEIIVYGIELRMFEGQASVNDEPITPLQISTPKSILPDLQQYMGDLLFDFEHNDLTAKIPKSPKLITLQTLHHIIHYKEDTKKTFSSDLPLFGESPGTSIISQDQLKRDWESSPHTFHGIGNPDKNTEFIALNEIIDTLGKNHIKVLIFTTPYSKVYLDFLSDSDKQTYNSMLEELSKKSDTKVYSIYEKYANLPIWNNYDHVAYNKNSTIYSQDIAKMISDRIKS
jgi:hypothetical protein